jgi:hypothetical protein
MPVTVHQIADMLTATLYDDSSNKISNIDPNLLRNHVAVRRLLDPAKVTLNGGKAVRFDLNVRGDDGSAEYVGAYKVEQCNASDFIVQGSEECRFAREKYTFDEQEEVFNKGKFAIVQHIKNRRQNAKIALIKKIETQFWGETAYANRGIQANGILNLLPYCATEGFVGTYATSYTTVHGVSPDTYTGWKSYGGPYAAITQEDLIIKMRTAWSKIHFEPPLDTMLIPDYKMGDRMGLYMNLSTVQQFENQLRLQNDSLGDDVAWESGRAKFKGTPLTEVAALESNTRNPVLGINWGLLNHWVQSGWWFKPKVMQAANQPLVVLALEYICHQIGTENRRELGFNFATA